MCMRGRGEPTPGAAVVCPALAAERARPGLVAVNRLADSFRSQTIVQCMEFSDTYADGAQRQAHTPIVPVRCLTPTPVLPVQPLLCALCVHCTAQLVALFVLAEIC
jgi:hypothetical protein